MGSALVASCALVSFPLQAAARPASESPARAAAIASTLAQGRSILAGVSLSVRPGSPSALDEFAAASGRPPGLVNVFRAFDTGFDAAVAATIWRQGAIPMVTWEPWSPGEGVSQPAYRLSRIAGGAFDGYVAAWANAAADWGRPLLLRFAPEMNGDWAPWAADVNGNSAADYVRAWRRVHGIFQRAGATNVAWVWSPNVVYPGSTPLRSVFPGAAYVDWIGVDGYNWGRSREGQRWRSFAEIFTPTLREVRRLAKKPLVISEVATAESGGSKAAWIRAFFASIERSPDILGFVWFNYDKEADWRIESSAGSRAAFARAVAKHRYVGPWPQASGP